MSAMTARYGPLERALANLRRLQTQAIDDLVNARINAGLSRRVLGERVGLSAAQIGRIERRERAMVPTEDLARIGAGVGLRFHFRFYPDGDAVRDAPQVRLLGRLQGNLPAGPRFRAEVAVGGADDLRAWDAVIDEHGCVDAVEAETRFADAQATVRRVMLKARDDQTVQHVVLLLADTQTNRRALQASRSVLRDTFPVDTRQAMASLRRGECPGANAIVIL